MEKIMNERNKLIKEIENEIISAITKLFLYEIDVIKSIETIDSLDLFYSVQEGYFSDVIKSENLERHAIDLYEFYKKVVEEQRYILENRDVAMKEDMNVRGFM